MKLPDELLAKLMAQYEATAHIDNLYRCWDCDKELKDLPFDSATKRHLHRSSDGHYLIICKDCVNNDNY